MKTALLVIHTTQVAGAEKIVSRIVSHFSREIDSGFRVKVASLRKPAHVANELSDALGLRAILFGKFDVIHSHLFLPGLLVRMRKVFDRRSLWIHTVHYAGYEGQSWRSLKRWLDRVFIFPAADRLVAVSPAVYASLKRHRRLSLIDNGIELKRFSAPPRRIGPGDTIVLGTVSMLRPEKGLDELLQSVSLLRTRHINVRLRIAGEGCERGRLESKIAKLHLQEAVELLGYVEDIAVFYRSLDIFVMATRSESYGLVIYESLQFGLPLLVPNVGNCASIAGHGRFGRVIERDENFAPRLADAIEEMRPELTEWRDRALEGLRFHMSESQNAKQPSMPAQYAELYRRLTSPGLCMISPIVTQATGGIQKQILLQSRELARRGYRIFILQRRDRAGAPDPSWEHVEFLTTPDFLPWLFRDRRFAMRVRGALFVVFGLIQIARLRHRIEILHAHQLFSPTLVACVAKKIFGMLVVVKVTASGKFGESQQLRSLPFFALRKRLFKAIDRVIVLTDEMRNEIQEIGFDARRVALIPNSVGFVASERSIRAIQRPLEILYCGRLSVEKSLPTLIEAVIRLAQSGIASRLKLVGGDHGGRADSARLKALCESLPALIEVQFLGHQAEVTGFYERADVFVLPSLSEGMSNSLLEALACGLVCIVSDIPENAFVVLDGVNGLHFKVGDSEDLKEKLELISRDLDGEGLIAKELSRQAKRTIAERFSVQSVGDQLCRIYESRDVRP